MAQPGQIPFRSGPMRHVVEIQEIRDVAAQSGGTKPQPVFVARRAAEVRPLSSRELIRASQSQVRSTWQIRLRYFAGLTGKHILVWVDGARRRTFQLDGDPIDTDARHREHVCLATEAA